MMKYAMKLGAMALGSALLAACGSSSNNNVQQDAQFEVRMTNLTNAQPLSPVAVMMHKSGFHSFIDGETASLALEALAEGGSNVDVLSEAQAATEHVASGSTAGPVGPGSISDVVTLAVEQSQLPDLRLSVISMLVHTNDGFTGANAANISNMAVGDSKTMTGPTWDSGTESNSETAATMPGPDFAGEGFNAARDDIIDKVRIHQGAVSSASVESGLASSDLLERHRFLNPSSRIVVTRTQ